MTEETGAAENGPRGVVLARAIRRSIIAGALGSIYAMLVIGFFRAGYARALGLSNIQFGFMSAIPMLVFPARLLASFIVEHIGRRKRFFTVTAISSRLVWIGIICLPFVLTDSSPFRSRLFLMLLLSASAIGAMAEPAWFSWIGDLIPEKMRARYWSKRFMWVGLTGIVPTILLAVTNDTLSLNGKFESGFTGFAVVFGFALLCGIVDIVIHYGMPEPPMSRPEHEPQRLEMILKPIKDPKFRPYLVFNAAWTFSLMLVGQFGFKYFFEVTEGKAFDLNIGPVAIVVGPFTRIALIASVGAFASIAGYSVWGVLVQRYGSKPILQLCTLLACVTPLPWLFVTPEHPYWGTTVTFMMGGIVFSGMNHSRMNLLYGLSPKQNRSMYIAVNLTVTGICGSVAPILAGLFMEYSIDKLFFGISGFYVLCIATTTVRLYTRTLLYRVQEGKNVTPGFLVRRLTEANPLRVFPSIYALSAPATEEKKLSAVGHLADSRSKLATKDLVEHLDDPSPKVREEAVRALARSKDPEAVDALIQKLASPRHGLEPQSARALGEIGDRRGVQPLIDSLKHPDPRIRASAAQALGDIGDRRANEPLFHLLMNDQDELAFGYYATALSTLGEISAIWHILPVMRNTQSVVFRRQLAVAIGNLIGEPKVFYGYLDEECKVFGQRVVKILNRCRRLISRMQNNPLYHYRDLLLELMAETETTYLREDWTSCADNVARATEVFTDAVFNAMATAGTLPAEARNQNLGRFEKIFVIVGQDEKRGMQLWYSAVLTHEKDPEFEKLTFQGCLLDIYVLELAAQAIFPPRTSKAQPGAWNGIGQSGGTDGNDQ